MTRNHLQLNLNRHPTSCFFNLVTTLLDISPDKCPDKTQLLNPNVNQQQPQQPLFSLKHLTENFPKDYYIYFCLNCRLFYSSTSTFSHNCWCMSTAGHEPTTVPNNTNPKSSPMTNGGKPQSSSANNYFSPIYLKFNVPQMFDRSGMGGKSTGQTIAATTTATPTSGGESSSSASGGSANSSSTDLNGSPSLGGGRINVTVGSAVTRPAETTTAYSNKRLRVDSIIEKLKP